MDRSLLTMWSKECLNVPLLGRPVMMGVSARRSLASARVREISAMMDATHVGAMMGAATTCGAINSGWVRRVAAQYERYFNSDEDSTKAVSLKMN